MYKRKKETKVTTGASFRTNQTFAHHRQKRLDQLFVIIKLDSTDYPERQTNQRSVEGIQSAFAVFYFLNNSK